MTTALDTPPANKKAAAAAAAKKAAIDAAKQACLLKAIIAYDIEGHYIGTRPPCGDEAYLSTRAVVDAHRVEETVDNAAIVATKPPTKYLCTHHDLLLLAATAYGEASTLDCYEEMAGIASVLWRQMSARGCATMSALRSKHPSYAYGWSTKNPRFKNFESAHPEKVDKREKNDGMRLAIKGAINAVTGGTDYSNGAYFWDGVDLGTNYDHHPKIQAGYKFTSDAHRIYKVDGAPITDNAVSHPGKSPYDYTYETTAARGKTVFSKFTSDYQTGAHHPASYI